jgi:PleD family two-component response regulator
MPAAREDAATTDEAILNPADAMLYQAKRDGGDRVVIVN